MQVIVELIARVEREEPVERMEQTLRRDPTIAFRLLRYIDSSAFGLRVEVPSFAHAMALLGHGRLTPLSRGDSRPRRVAGRAAYTAASCPTVPLADRAPGGEAA